MNSAVSQKHFVINYDKEKFSALVICVNYKNENETIRFVKNVLSQRGAEKIKVLVVDNSMCPPADCLTDLFNLHKQVILLSPRKNLGYFGGSALGLRHYVERFTLPEWIVVSNTDIELLQGDFFAILHAEHSISPPAIVAPAIYSSLTNREQNPFLRRRPSSARMHFYSWIFRFSPFLNAYERLSNLKWHTRKMINTKSTNASIKEGRPFSIYAPHGSFLIFHRKYFEEGGTLDHGVFLFGEEIFVAETARRLGLEIIYDPKLKVLHREHSTTKHSEARDKYIAEGAAYCAKTFFMD